MFDRTAYDNTRPDGFPVMEAVNGWEGERRRFVPLRRSSVSGTIAGPLASLRLTQVFGYSSSECSKVLEAAYRFPLPGDAAVLGVRVRFGEVTITASLKDRQAAEKEYEEAKQQGQQAAIATRESVDVFTLRVAGIKPDEDIVVETDYVQLARPEGSGWSLRLPLTTAPRYVRSDESQTHEAAGQPLLLLRDPGHRFSLCLRLLAAAEAQSPTHALAISRDGEAAEVSLAEGEVLPDRDLLLEWQPTGAGDRPKLRVLGGALGGDDLGYYLALVAPPSGDGVAGVSQEATLLVDHSGSMGGAKWEAADWAVRKFLLGLSEGSSFNLCLFHGRTLWFRGAPVPVSEENVQEALRFLEDKSSGGTELGVALEQALSQERTAGVQTRHVFLITDAEVSDAARILRLAQDESHRGDRRRISVLCIDAAPNSYLAQELAEQGGGVARFLTSAPDEGDITTALDAILEDWSQPVLANLRLEVASGAESSGHAIVDLGDMPRGRALWTAVSAPAAEAVPFRLTVGGETIASAVAERADTAVVSAMKALYGARRLRALEHLAGAQYERDEVATRLRALGYDPEGRTSHGTRLYAENRRADAYEMVRGLLVSESLYYGVASSSTAFVAVREEAGKRVEGTVLVANALPQGWSDSFLARAAPAGAARMMGLGWRTPSAGISEAMPCLAIPAMPVSVGAGLAPAPGVPAKAYRVVFQGRAAATKEAVLFDSSATPGVLATDATMRWLRLLYPAGAPATVDRGLTLLVFVGDMTQPRARVRLADLLRQGGERPLNLRRSGDEPVRLVLADANGAWAAGAPEIEVSLAV